MYQTLIFKPLYNGFVMLMDLLPWIDVGVVVVIFTVIVKLILFPLSKASLVTQVKMKEVEPEMNKIKAQYANDKQVQALKIMELYKVNSVKPLLGIFLVFLQFPILIALISVFYKIIPTVHPELLYSFVGVPVVKTQFLGFIDLTHKSLILAIFTAVSQFIQLHFSISNKPQKNIISSEQPDATVMVAKYMKYTLPIFIFAITYIAIPAQFPQAASIVAIYLSISSLFTLGQELVIRRHIARHTAL